MPMKGYNGAVNGVGGVFYWEIDEEASENPAPNSATENLANELPGTTNWWGSYMQHGPTPASNPNESLSFAGTIDQDDSSNNQYSGTALVERWQVNLDFANNRPIWNQVWFRANSALTKDSASVTDATTPEWYMSGDGKVQIGTAVAAPVYADLDDVIAARLMCMSEVDSIVTSSTSNQARAYPGNMKYAIDLAVHVDDVVAMETLNAEKAVKLFVDGSTFWQAEYVIWKRLGNFKVDIAGRQFVAVQYRGLGAGWIDVAGTWTKGGLTDPDSTAIWPVP